MPTYEYLCAKCGQQFEKFQSIADKALSVCPQDRCGQKKWGKGKVKRMIVSGGGLIFKGSGFYVTDYRSEKYKEAAKKDSPPASSGDGKASTTKSDSKPASGASPAKPAKPAASGD
ncbi:MAG: zinc ribbon domain-containing protein [Verrucomicrobiota bacterium]